VCGRGRAAPRGDLLVQRDLGHRCGAGRRLPCGLRRVGVCAQRSVAAVATAPLGAPSRCNVFFAAFFHFRYTHGALNTRSRFISRQPCRAAAHMQMHTPKRLAATHLGVSPPKMSLAARHSLSRQRQAERPRPQADRGQPTPPSRTAHVGRHKKRNSLLPRPWRPCPTGRPLRRQRRPLAGLVPRLRPGDGIACVEVRARQAGAAQREPRAADVRGVRLPHAGADQLRLGEVEAAW
jgi:hypothetical protein